MGSTVPLEDHGARVAAVAGRHESALLRVARQSSLCDDDAFDAYQRAMEIFFRRVDTVDPATELAWLKVVVRHEALAIRRARSESVTGDHLDVDSFMPGPERSVEDQIASGERVRRSAEALRALKPDEARALMMKAQGLSYEEIGQRNGWSYTKVNRAITEGRRRFMRVYAEIESGEECARFAPIVEALAAGAATSAQVVEIRPHLRHCVACRATVRELHVSRLRRAQLFWPLFGVLEPLRRPFERSPTPAASTEPGTPAPDATDLCIEVPVRPDRLNPEVLLETEDRITALSNLKHDIASLCHRANASDVATSIHIATVTGGGRVATIGTVLGLCLSSIGAGTVCVVTGIVPDPLGIVRDDRDAAKPRADAPRPVVRNRAREPSAPNIEPTSFQPTPTPTATRQPTRQRERDRSRAPRASVDPSQGTKPASHENPPISPPASAARSQESFTPEAAPRQSVPAAAPVTGGEEFMP